MPKNRFFLAFFSFFSFLWELTEVVAAGAHCGYFLQQSEANVALHFHRRHLFFSFSFLRTPQTETKNLKFSEMFRTQVWAWREKSRSGELRYVGMSVGEKEEKKKESCSTYRMNLR
jgi:hypothetical protein